MSRPVMHMARIIRTPLYTRTTTLCGRETISNGAEGGINSTRDEIHVTCKLCKRRFYADLDRKRAARELTGETR